MKRSIVLISLAALLATGCARSYRDTTLYQVNGRAKPIVSVLPVIDSASEEAHARVCWDLAQEFTEGLRTHICDSSRLYLMRDKENYPLALKLNSASLDEISKTKLADVGAAEYLVITELIEQQERPVGVRNQLGESAVLLCLDFRVKVIDVRKESPKVILQEVVHQEHLVPRPYLHCDYKKSRWGTDSFENTPMGMAHSRLIREVVSRVESYIDSSR